MKKRIPPQQVHHN